ncbi:MAG: hypothetical protein EB136_05655 [Synechococcaceae bacterium WBB_3_034]|nr:hypothetical protein [Synechococcaceae bacterium WBB_3_034]
MRRRQLLQLLSASAMAASLAVAGSTALAGSGRVRFLAVADTGSGNSHQRAVGAQWLRSVLGSSTAPWKVVVGHHPIYSSGYYGNNASLQAKIGALMQRHGVQLYINGHEHNYERSRPIDGITYLVVGGGGASLRPILPTDQSARAISTYSFAEIEAGPKELTVAAWDSKGQLIDRAVVARR